MRRTCCAAVLLFAMVWVPDALARRTTGALSGQVRNQQGAGLPGAAVVIASPALIGARQSAVTDAQGRFRFPELPPGQYRVTASVGGYKTVEISRVSVFVGEEAEVPVEMQLFGGEETIVVRAEPPAIDRTSSAFPTILTPDYLRHIPNDRDPSHIFNLAPGINTESAFGGGEESGNAYEIDGVDVSDPQGGAPWSLFNYSLIHEVQLAGLGAPAEYGQFTGVVFNSVTKSGGEEPSGTVEGFYTDQFLTGNSVLEDVNASIDRDWESTLEVGGPLRRDKMWFFFSSDYHRVASSEGGPTQREATPRAFFKLTSLWRNNSTLHGWLEWDHVKVTGRDATDLTPIEATTGEDNPNRVGNLSFDSLFSPASVMSLAWSGYSGRQRFNPFGGFSTPGHLDAQTGLASVNAAQFGAVDRSRNQFNASFAHHASNLIAGYHDFKVGTEIERSVARDHYGFPGGAFYTDNEGPVIDPSTGKSDLYSLVSLGGGYDVRGQNQRVSLYAQDSWRITPRLTLNPGIRLDRNRGKVAGGTVFSTNPVAPRIGLACDLRGDGRTIIRAHYGRYYEALYSAFYDYMTPGGFEPLTTKRIFNTSGFTQTLSTIPGQRYAMDPHIRQPRLDQFVVGVDHQLARGIVLSAALVHRKNADFIETVSRDGIFVPVQGQVPGTGQKVTLYDYLNPQTDVLLYTNPRGLHRAYNAAILSATRPLRNNWQLAASYVYSRARGNIDNLGFDELGTGGNTPFFQGGFLDTPNSLVNAEGRLTHDQTHQLKLQGTRIFARPHLSVSAAYAFVSGDTWAPRATCLLTTSAQGVTACHDFPQGPVVYFAEPRGSRRLKARNDLDVRTEWHHGVWGARELRLGFDVFNLLNRARATQVDTVVGPELGKPTTANFAVGIRLFFAIDW